MSPWWLVAGTAFILIGITKSGFGSGVGLMVVPMTIMAAPHLPSTGGVQHVLGLVSPCNRRRHHCRRAVSPAVQAQVVKRLLPETAIGISIGGVLLWSMGEQRPNYSRRSSRSKSAWNRSTSSACTGIALASRA